jgi:hypothetical protein
MSEYLDIVLAPSEVATLRAGGRAIVTMVDDELVVEVQEPHP